MRISLKVDRVFFYDVGLRKGNPILSKRIYIFSSPTPRYLEDFIETFGISRIKILDYGSLSEEKDYIDGLLK